MTIAYWTLLAIIWFGGGTLDSVIRMSDTGQSEAADAVELSLANSGVIVIDDASTEAGALNVDVATSFFNPWDAVKRVIGLLFFDYVFFQGWANIGRAFLVMIFPGAIIAKFAIDAGPGILSAIRGRG